jgi:hypothetical protein
MPHECHLLPHERHWMPHMKCKWLTVVNSQLTGVPADWLKAIRCQKTTHDDRSSASGARTTACSSRTLRRINNIICDWCSSIEVDSRLLTLSRLLRDFFLRSRQSFDSFFESRPTVDSWSSFKKNVKCCNYDDRPRSQLLTLTEFFEDFEAILYEFFHFPTENPQQNPRKVDS